MHNLPSRCSEGCSSFAVPSSPCLRTCLLFSPCFIPSHTRNLGFPFIFFSLVPFPFPVECLWHDSRIIRRGQRPRIHETASVSVAVPPWLSSRGHPTSSVGRLLLECSKRVPSPSPMHRLVTASLARPILGPCLFPACFDASACLQTPVLRRAAACVPFPTRTEGPFPVLPKQLSCHCAQGQKLSPPLLSV